MNEITLKLETKTVECESIKTDWKWVMGEPEFGISRSAHRSLILIFKNSNFVRRLKNRCL